MVTYGSVRRMYARFDCFQVDLSSSELFRSGVRVPIQEKPLQVLRLLLEAEGSVVTREQLRSALWPEDTFVDFEHGVNTAVKKLRRALEDSAESPRFVETLPKVGYRFIFQVQWVVDGSGNNAPPNVVSISQPRPTDSSLCRCQRECPSEYWFAMASRLPRDRIAPPRGDWRLPVAASTTNAAR